VISLRTINDEVRTSRGPHGRRSCGTLFAERCAYTASYSLSPAEADLYQAVTTYVREEMNRADRTGDDKRRMNVGFALQILEQRSPQPGEGDRRQNSFVCNDGESVPRARRLIGSPANSVPWTDTRPPFLSPAQLSRRCARSRRWPDWMISPQFGRARPRVLVASSPREL